MARGRKPKSPEVRRRRNKTATAATLAAPARRRARRRPQLPRWGTTVGVAVQAVVEEAIARIRKAGGEPPALDWHPQTVAWWTDVWHSPMAEEFLEADRHALVRLAVLVEQFWRSPSKEIAAEIRLQESRFGLTPQDRHRLQWKVEKGGGKSAPPPAAAPPAAPADDPRRGLRAV